MQRLVTFGREEGAQSIQVSKSGPRSSSTASWTKSPETNCIEPVRGLLSGDPVRTIYRRTYLASGLGQIASGSLTIGELATGSKGFHGQVPAEKMINWWQPGRSHIVQRDS